MHFDLVEIIKTVSYVGIFLIVFSESGLFIGIFFPGDSLLFTAGFLASEGILYLPLLIAVCTLAAISGDAVGFAFGKRFGRRLYKRPDSRWFKQKHLRAAEAFYERHGGKTIVMARFLPIIRTLAPIVAGAANMDYRRFVVFNATGGLLWGAGMPTAGYLLGSVIPDVDRYLLPILFVIIVISLLPSAIHVFLEHRHEIMSRVRSLRANDASSGIAARDEAPLREDRAER